MKRRYMLIRLIHKMKSIKTILIMWKYDEKKKEENIDHEEWVDCVEV